MHWTHELEIARRAAARAGEEVLRQYHAFECIPDAPSAITTEADHAAQEIILTVLAEAFPQDAFIAEESTPALADLLHAGRRVWVIDPIDGTRGFARKTGEFSLMIGLAVDGRPVVGVVHEPVPGRTTWATLGGGCFWLPGPDGDARHAGVSVTAALPDATLAMSRSQEARRNAILAGFGATRAALSYSSGVKLAMIARGEADLYLGDYLGYRDWDLCAGHILVEEAGGRVTDRDGDRLVYARETCTHPRGILATNGALHADALSAVRAAGW